MYIRGSTPKPLGQHIQSRGEPDTCTALRRGESITYVGFVVKHWLAVLLAADSLVSTLYKEEHSCYTKKSGVMIEVRIPMFNF
jgi:hypothetical protein